MRKHKVILLAALFVGGCDLSPLIDSAAVDYNQVEEDVNNQALVINVLRARDGAPLYLAEIQSIRNQYNLTAGTGTLSLPFGPGKLSGKKFSDGPSTSISSQPSFEIDQLDAQDFTLGILRPIDATYWEYYWHRDYNPEILLHLFVQQAAEGITKQYDNSPCAPGIDVNDRCVSYDKFRGYVDDLVKGGVYLNVFRELTPINGDSKGANGDLNNKTADPNVTFAVFKGTRYLFDQSAPQVAICRKDKDQTWSNDTAKHILDYAIQPCHKGDLPSSSNNTRTSEFDLSTDENHAFDCTHTAIVVCRTNWDYVQQQISQGQSYVLRSVDGIIQYLGKVQRRVDADPGPDDQKKGVTWTEDGVVHTLFQLHRKPGDDRIEVSYRGSNYYVREGDATDHTLQVLSLLNQLINANKKASEIPTTKAVEIVP